MPVLEVNISSANDESTGAKNVRSVHFRSCCKMSSLEIQHEMVSDATKTCQAQSCHIVNRHRPYLAQVFMANFINSFVSSLQNTLVAEYESMPV